MTNIHTITGYLCPLFARKRTKTSAFAVRRSHVSLNSGSHNPWRQRIWLLPCWPLMETAIVLPPPRSTIALR